MINIKQVKNEELEIFNKKKIILYGVRPITILTYRVFKCLGFEVLGYCCETELGRIQHFKDRTRGLHNIKYREMLELINNRTDIVIQIVSSEPIEIEKIKNEIRNIGGICTDLESGMLINSFAQLVWERTLRNPIYVFCLKFLLNRKRKIRKDDYFLACIKQEDNLPVLICSPPKTGDFSIMYTLDIINSENSEDKIKYLNLWHRPYVINRKELQKRLETVKIIMGIREPIAQNLSVLYQSISGDAPIDRFIKCELRIGGNRNQIAQKYMTLAKNTNDAQVWWDNLQEMCVKYVSDTKKLRGIGLIQEFIDDFRNHVVDVLKYPFDKKKGFSVIKVGNMEIFLYQIEKLDTLSHELSEWIGGNCTEIVHGNDAAVKWIGESYKEALRNHQISKEYFECCFEEPYVQHCYSEQDIKIFKQKWKSHITDNKSVS